MKIESILQISNNELQNLLDNKSISENLLSDFFRKNKFIGSKERKLIQELIFAAIRHYGTISYLKTKLTLSDNSSLIAALIFSEKFFQHNLNDLTSLACKLYKIENNFNFLYELISHLYDFDYKTLEMQIDDFINKEYNIASDEILLKYSFPEFLILKLSKKLSMDQIKSIAHSYMKPSSITLRTNNSLDFNFDEFLNNNALKYNNSKLFDNAVNVFSRKSLINYDEYKEGKFEIQDESSMIVAYSFHYMEKDNILDACAGAGGKSLHIASITNDKSNIFAFDNNNFKLKILTKRAERNNIKSIKTINKKQLNNMKFDKILIDAPCTGSGTIRRNPALKYKITDEMIKEFTSHQTEILNYYSKFLKKGGQLVYSTCSILTDENEEVTNKFLIDNPNFKPLPFPENEIFSKLNVKQEQSEITIYPDLFDSDGFYIRSFVKNN